MTSTFSLVVSGDVVTPGGTILNGWVAVDGERIVALGHGPEPDAARHVDARGSLVLPGVIDGQTHAGSQFGFPGLEQTTRSAVAGGITTLVDMPYDEPDPVATVDILHRKIKAVAAFGYCDVALYGTLTNDGGLDAVEQLIEAGVCAFKVSSFENHPSRFPRITNDRMLALMERLAPTDVPLGLHNEDQEIVRATIARHRAEGRTAGQDHSPSRPEVAELVATAAFLEMGRATGARVHLVHLTSRRGFELVRRYQAEGARATGEMCVHYLHFDAAADMDRLGALMKVNPPIRPGLRDALWDELERSGVEFVSSDHSAWPLARKTVASIFDAPAGIPGLETLLPAFYAGLVARGRDAPALVARYLSERPARFFGLWPRKGAIAIGADADLTVLTPGETIFDATRSHDGLNWSPFHGEVFPARPTATFVRGRQVWDGTTVTGAIGHGRFIPREGEGAALVPLQTTEKMRAT